MKRLVKLWGIIAIGAVIIAGFTLVLTGCNTGTSSSTGSENPGGNDPGGGYTDGNDPGGNNGGNGNGSSNGGGTKPSTPQGVHLETYQQTGALKETNVYYRITWNAVAGATSYNLYRATSYSGPYSKNNISPITSTSLNNFYGTYGQGSTQGSLYFKISAVNSYGESGQSSIVSITPSVLGAY
jgi:hypothetical protein